jgi:hypothetical protein
MSQKTPIKVSEIAPLLLPPVLPTVIPRFALQRSRHSAALVTDSSLRPSFDKNLEQFCVYVRTAVSTHEYA